MLESLILTLPLFEQVNLQPAQPTDQAIPQDREKIPEIIFQPAQLSEQPIPQDMQQNTEVISQPVPSSQQVVNQAHENPEWDLFNLLLNEDRFEGDPLPNLNVFMDVPDWPLPQATEEADDLSEIDLQFEGG